MLEQTSQFLLHRLQIQLILFVLSRAILRLFCTCAVQELLRIKAEFSDAFWLPPSPTTIFLLSSFLWNNHISSSSVFWILGGGSSFGGGNPNIFSSSVLSHRLNYVPLYLGSGQYGKFMQLLFYEQRSSLKNLCVLFPRLVPPIYCFMSGK